MNVRHGMTGDDEGGDILALGAEIIGYGIAMALPSQVGAYTRIWKQIYTEGQISGPFTSPHKRRELQSPRVDGCHNWMVQV